MKILFHENQLSYRGTSVALYDYANFNEEILGNQSFIVYNSDNPNNNSKAIERFKDRFTVFSYQDKKELEKIVEQQGIDVFYAIKSGENDGVVVSNCKTCIHVVFKANEPHGDVYAYVSDWLAKEVSNNLYKAVPHIIDIPYTDENLRADLDINSNSKVFGYYGGSDSFDIKFVKKTVKSLAKKNPEMYFIFMGVENFCKKKYFWQKESNLKNIIFLPPNPDPIYKRKFINTCDAMLHARFRGETFGMAIGEFAICNKPIICYEKSDERNHIQILGENAYYYKDAQSLKQILTNAKLDVSAARCYAAFSPTEVMKKFKNVFLDVSE